MKILLAIDGSDFSKFAVMELAKMTLQKNCEICIINVYEHPSISSPELVTVVNTIDTYYQEYIKNIKKHAEKIILDAAKVLKEKNRSLSITTSAINGLPKSEILKKAESLDVDLIVVGSQGQGAFSRFLLGSVSQYIATHAKCSVLIVKKNTNNI